MKTRRDMNGIILGVLLCLAPVGVRPAAAQTTPDFGASLVFANGYGTIAIAPGRMGSFTFRIDPVTLDEDAAPVPGQVRFFNRVSGETVVSQAITSGFIAPGFVFVEGTCTINGRPGVFQMEAFDAQRLDQAPADGWDGFSPVERDNFFICYGDPFTGACVGGLVLTGIVNVDDQRVR